MPEDSDHEVLERALSYTFKDRALLKQALVHKSYLNEHRELQVASNGRLAFLGDAVLDLAAAEYSYKNELGDEDQLTQIWKKLTSDVAAAETARRLNLSQFLLLSKGERARNGNTREILSNAYEAMIGAVFLDGDYETAARVVRKTCIETTPTH